MGHFHEKDAAAVQCESMVVQEDGSFAFPPSTEAPKPWAFYDELIAGVPEGITVTDYCLGTNWSYVTASCGGETFCGIAFTASGGAKRSVRCDLRGRDLQEVCMLAKSWCFEEATLGIAALNAWYNRPALLDPLGMAYDEPVELPDGSIRKIDAFELYRPEISALSATMGKPAHVTIVGHFPHIERVAEYARVTVLERSCRDGADTPDPACEYVLPCTDYAFITGVTFINKTLPRLLTLCREAKEGAGAKVIMVGPSVVMAEPLFSKGVTSLSGSVVVDPEKIAFGCKNGAGQLFGEALQMCSVAMPK